VFCDDDVLAAALYKAARDVGLGIPRDLSVVGFDDIALARLLEPELTTVAVPAERLGQLGMQRLLGLLHGEAVPATPKLRLRLLVRASTAAPLYV
jgi:DNA-binding LacI/PurR family transcriptional regulator